MANEIHTFVSIGGKLNASLGGAVRGANLQLLSLTKQATRTNTALAGLGKTIIGYGAGLLAIGGATEFFKKSLEISKEEKGVVAALGGLIAHQNALRHVSLEVSKEQTESIIKQAEALQQQSGIYAGIYVKGAATLAQYKLTTQQIEQMQKGIGELLVYQTQMGKSSEEIQGTYESIGKAIYGGIGKGLKSAGIELTPMQLKVLKMNATFGDYAANIAMINREMERQHAGGMALRMQSLGGQAALAKANTTAAMKRIGDATLPFVQTLTVLASKFLPILVPPFEKLSAIVQTHFKEWTRIIEKEVVPAFRNFVTKGWDVIIKGIKFFQNNSKWLVPWLKLAIRTIPDLVLVITAWKVAQWGLNVAMSANPIGAMVTGAGLLALAAYEVIKNWDLVKQTFFDLAEFVVGTKALQGLLGPNVQKALPLNVRRAFGTEVRPATSVKEGLLGAWYNTLDQDTKNAIDNLKKNWGEFTDWFKKQFTGEDWQLLTTHEWELVIDAVQKAVKSMGEFVTNSIRELNTIVDVTKRGIELLQNAWQTLISSIRRMLGGDEMPSWYHTPFGQLKGRIRGGMDPNRPGGALQGQPINPYTGKPYSQTNPNIPNWYRNPYTYGNVTGPVNMTHFGYEKYGEPNYDSASARGEGRYIKHMIPFYDAAVMDKDVKAWGLVPGQPFTYLGHKYRLGDRIPSRYSDSRIDVYDPANRLGDHSNTATNTAASNRMDQTTKGMFEGIRKGMEDAARKVGDVHLHSHAEYHIHGSDLDSGIETHHRKHIESMRRMLSEVIYRNNRAEFA